MAKKSKANKDWNSFSDVEQRILYELMQERKKELRRKSGSRVGRLPKFDYDSEEWYSAISELAMQGRTDEGIAYGLADRFGQSLDPSVFTSMLNGTYRYWPQSLRAERGEKIRKVLAHARANVNSIVKGRYLKAALGGMKLKTKNTTSRHLVIDGVPTEDEIVQTTISETETAPNIQALSTWLYHHDPEWRKVQRGEDPEEPKTEATKGVDISRWIELECGIGNEESI